MPKDIDSYELPYTIEDRMAQAEACGFYGPSRYGRFMSQLYADPGKLRKQGPIQWPEGSDHKGERLIKPSRFLSGPPERKRRGPEPGGRPYKKLVPCTRCHQKTPYELMTSLYYQRASAPDFRLCPDCMDAIREALPEGNAEEYIKFGPVQRCLRCRQSYRARTGSQIYISRHPSQTGLLDAMPRLYGTLCGECKRILTRVAVQL